MIASSPMAPPPTDATPEVTSSTFPAPISANPAGNRAGVNVTNQQVLQRCAHLGDRATLDREDQPTAHAAVTIGPGSRWRRLAAPAAECRRSGRKGLLEPYRDQLLDQRPRKGFIDAETQGP